MSTNPILNTAIHYVTQTATYASGANPLLAAGQQAIGQTARNAFSDALTHLGVTGSAHDAAMGLFDANFTQSSGFPAGTSQTSQAVLDSSFRNGALATTSQNVTDAVTRMTIALGMKGQQDAGGTGGGSGGESWLEAIARAMGKALGTMAQNLVNESNELSGLAGNSSGSGAQQFQTVMAQFQAHSQLFGMLSDAFANAIKSIGQGMQTMGSKT
jgi:uncharacterized protein YukE